MLPSSTTLAKKHAKPLHAHGDVFFLTYTALLCTIVLNIFRNFRNTEGSGHFGKDSLTKPPLGVTNRRFWSLKVAQNDIQSVTPTVCWFQETDQHCEAVHVRC